MHLYDLSTQVQVTRILYLLKLFTENSAIVYDKYYILIYDIEVTEYSHNSVLGVFQTNRMRICHLLRRLASAQFVRR